MSLRSRALLAGFAVAAVYALLLPSTAAGEYAFQPSGLDGGGVQNVVAIDPLGSGLVLAGGDVSGIHRSTDLGTTWETAGAGIVELLQLRIADIAFSTSVPGKVFAGAGDEGAGGGMLASLDGGRTWELRSTTPQFAGNNTRNVPALPPTHPRSTGDLIAIDDDRGLLYAATFRDGVMRSADDGRTWEVLGLAGSYLRSLVRDPSRPDVLYTSAYGGRVWRIESANGTPTITQLLASPLGAEELTFVGSDLYAAAGTSGVFHSPDGGSSWSAIGGATVTTTGPYWISIAGYPRVGAPPVLFVGTHLGRQSGSRYESVLRSTDGGQTFVPITLDPARIHLEVGGPGGDIWWEAARNPFFVLGGSAYVATQIAIDPVDPRRVLVAGRDAVWSSTDGGDNWYPLVRGLGVTVNQTVVADPNTADRVYVGNTDFTFFSSTDSLARVTQAGPPKSTPVFSVGYAIALDTATTPSRVYLGVGNRDVNDAGEIWSNADPAAESAWVDEGLSDVAGYKRPLAVAVGRQNGAPVVLAAVETGGVWRKAGSVWQQVSIQAMGTGQSVLQSSFSWPAGSNLVYLYDRKTGVWRSADAGVTWTLIWRKLSPPARTGYLAADPADPTTLYVSAADGLYRLDAAGSGTVESGTIVPVGLGTLTAPGPIAVEAGALYATVRVVAGGSPALLRSQDRGATWEDIADDVYRSAAGFPVGLAFAGDGRAFVATRTTGLLVGSPPAGDTTAPAPPTGLTAAGGVGIVTLDWADSPESDLAGYQVHRRNPDLTWPSTPLATTAGSAFTDDGRTAGTTYVYSVTAYDVTGNESIRSELASATPRVPLTVQYVPAGYTVAAGRLTDTRDVLVKLAKNDSKRVEVESAPVTGGHAAELVVSMTIRAVEQAGLRKLTVEQDGNANSSAVALTLQIYDWTSGTWLAIDGPRSGVTSDRLATWSTTTNPVRFVSPAGEIRVGVRGTATARLKMRTDQVRVSIEY